jgi:Asp-tRNA(Asn)/Glu-tRNA(Gln) amidotransferase A subunit family amidase
MGLLSLVIAAACGGSQPVPRAAAPCDESFSVFEATIADLQAAIRAGRTSCRAIVLAYLERIARYDQPTGLNAITAIDPTAIERADEIDRAVASGAPLGPLFCAPILIKDNFDTVGLATTGGSITLVDNIAYTDAFVVRKLKAAGAIVLAKTNMAEWGLDANGTDSSTAGVTANAYDLDRVASGSSGGTASGVAASFGVGGLGTDTGDSIRGPSSHAALVGIRVTMGLTSRTGVIPVLRDRDVTGPMTRTVEDAARLLQAIAGYDSGDAMTRLGRGQRERDYTAFLDANGLAGARIGVLRSSLSVNDVDSEISRLFEAALRDLETAGATLVDPFVIDGLAALRDANRVCERFRYDLHQYLVDRGAGATFTDIATLTSNQHAPATGDRLRAAAKQPLDVPPDRWAPPCPGYADNPERQAYLAAVVAAMDAAGVDAIVYPTWTRMPPHLVAVPGEGGGDRDQSIAPATGQPAITVPMGLAMDQLPVGLELLGRPFAEGTLIRLAYGYEQATHRRKPPTRFEPRFVEGCTGDRTVAPRSLRGE